MRARIGDNTTSSSFPREDTMTIDRIWGIWWTIPVCPLWFALPSVDGHHGSHTCTHCACEAVFFFSCLFVYFSSCFISNAIVTSYISQCFLFCCVQQNTFFDFQEKKSAVLDCFGEKKDIHVLTKRLGQSDFPNFRIAFEFRFSESEKGNTGVETAWTVTRMTLD